MSSVREVRRSIQRPTVSAQVVPRNGLTVIKPVTESIPLIPATRYYGSKRKLLPWVYKTLSGIKFHSVLDAFGGSAVVSLLFQYMHKEVTYHDGLRFNQDVALTLLTPKLALERSKLVQVLRDVVPLRGVVSRNFGGIFYLDEENEWIDGFMASIEGSTLSRPGRALLRYLLYQACLKKRPFNLFHRANLSLRTNSVDRSFGNLRTWNRGFDEHVLQAFDELACRPREFITTATVAAPGDASRLKGGYDLVYLDPPYISENEGHNRDNYWRRYHFLEGLARYTEWESMLDHTSPIRMIPMPEWMATWSSKDTFTRRLFRMIERHKNSIVVLSYVKSAFPSDAEIREVFESSFANVSVHSTSHAHALSQTRKRELLFIGYPR